MLPMPTKDEFPELLGTLEGECCLCACAAYAWKKVYRLPIVSVLLLLTFITPVLDHLHQPTRLEV